MCCKVEREIQRVTASNFNTGSSTNEKQEVTIEENSGSISDATYQLGLYGVYTSKFLNVLIKLITTISLVKIGRYVTSVF